MGLTKPRAAQIFNLDYKQSTRVVTATNITLAGGAPNAVDGINLSLGDRVLVTGQTTGSQNGLYYVSTLGSGSNGTWSRTSDGNENGEIEAGMIVMVTEGIIYADTQWKLITNDPIVIGTTALTFTQNYAANSISSGTSNVVVNNNANVTISSAGTANVLTVANTGTFVIGVVSTTGNIIAGNVLFGSGIVSGTGNVFATNLTGNLSNSTVDGTNSVGFLTIPQNSQSAAYTLVAADSGKQIFHPSADTTARTWTIPANSSVPFPVGTAVTFINQNGAGVITIAITTDTMRLAGAGTTGSRTLAANGIATAIKITSTEWIISGTGLT